MKRPLSSFFILLCLGFSASTAQATNYDRSFKSPGTSTVTMPTGSHATRVTGFNIPRITDYDIKWSIRAAGGSWTLVKTSDLGYVLLYGDLPINWNGTRFLVTGDSSNWTLTASYMEVRAQVLQNGSPYEYHYWNITGQVLQYTVNASAGTGGTVSPSSRTVTHGNTTTFTVSPDAYYTRNSVSGDASGGSWNGNTYTTAPVTQNRNLTFSFTPWPDLIVTSVWTEPATLVEGQDYVIKVVVRNQGVANADPPLLDCIEMAFWVDGVYKGGERALDLCYSIAANGGEFTFTSITLTAPAAGSHTILAKADWNDSLTSDVDEINEGNNEKSVGIDVAVAPAILSAYWWMPLDVSDGDTVTMCAEVEGIPVDAECTFQVYEDDGGWPFDDTVGSPVSGAVYTADGKTYVRATCAAVWQGDQWGDPEHYFKVTYGSVSLYSSRSENDELIVRNDRQQPSSTNGDFYYSTGEATSQSTLTDDRTPLILIHGASGDRKIDSLNYWYGWANGDMTEPESQIGRLNMADMRSRFRVYRYVYDSRRSIADNGQDFAAFLNQFYASHSDFAERQVVIMAHSMGGLVSRYAFNTDIAFRAKVHRLITLGTPHLGSPLANPSWVRHESPSESGREIVLSIFYYSNFGGTQGDFDLAWYNISQVPASARVGGVYHQWVVNNDYFRQDLLDASLTDPFAGTGTMTGSVEDAKIIAYGGHFSILIDGQGPTWPEEAADEVIKYGITDHSGLHTLRNALWDMNNDDGSTVGDNDGMVPLTSALLGNGHADVEKLNLTQANGEPVDHSSYLDVASTMDYVAKRLLTMVKVTISPQVAVEAGARWRIAGGEWQKSGVSLSALRAGQYTIEFKDVTGWTKPNDQTITVTENQTYSLGGVPATYTLDPFISVTPASRDFGSIDVGTTADRTFTVQNTGGGTLSGSASVSAPYFIVSGGTYNLGEGASQIVTVRYSPTAAGTHNRDVTFTGGGGATRPVSGRADAWVPFVPPAEAVAISVVTSNGPTKVNVAITFASTGYRVGNWGNPVAEAGGFTVDASIERWTGVSAMVLTVVSHEYDLGTLASDAYTFTFRAQGTTVRSVPFEVLPVIAVTPASQEFGSIEVGTTSERTFMVQNVGGGMLSGNASVSSPYSIVSGETYNLGGGASQIVTVRYSPTAAGTHDREVTFTDGGGATRLVTGKAHFVPGLLSIDVIPDIGSWSLTDSPDSYSGPTEGVGDLVPTEAAVGSYTIQYGDLTQCTSPSPQTHSVNSGELTTFTGIYNYWPVITEGTGTEVMMSEDASPTNFYLTLHSTDEENDTITWCIKSQATNGTARASGTGNAKAIDYTPNTNFFGRDSFVVEVNDEQGGRDQITVNVTIEPVNDPPVFESIQNQAVDEGQILTLPLYASDVDDDELIFSMESGPGTVAGADYTYSPDLNASTGSPYTVTILVVDPSGEQDSQMFQVVVKDVPSYTLTIVKGGTGDGRFKINGVIQESPYTKTFAENTQLALEACPAAPNTFEGWSGDVTSTDSNILVTLSNDCELVCNFASTPFKSVTIPGVIQCEDFDEGGEDIAYHDTTASNEGNSSYRDGEGVDIKAKSVAQNGNCVIAADPGEWLEYTINVATGGLYKIGVIVAMLGDGGTFHFQIDGSNVDGSLRVPDTGGWYNWTTLSTKCVLLNTGEQILTMMLDTPGGNGRVGIFDAIIFELIASNDDQDKDGRSDWEEYMADTDPANSNSVLKLYRIRRSENGLQIEWQGGEWATQYLECVPSLDATTGCWSVIHTQEPKTPITNWFLDLRDVEEMYYRIRTTR